MVVLEYDCNANTVLAVLDFMHVSHLDLELSERDLKLHPIVNALSPVCDVKLSRGQDVTVWVGASDLKGA